MLLTLTDVGRNAINAALKTRVRRLHELADTLTADELDRVSQALRKLLLAVDRSADRREASAVGQ